MRTNKAARQLLDARPDVCGRILSSELRKDARGCDLGLRARMELHPRGEGPTQVSPDSWLLQRALVNRPGNKEIMLALLYDYRTNLGHYAKWQEYFRKRQPPMLIVWGKNDVIFPAAGAHRYLHDLPEAELHLLDTGHFALEDKAEEIAGYMRDFLDRKLSSQ